MYKILFQGDSVTDGNRFKDAETRWNLCHQIGHSYAYIVSAKLGYEHPGRFEFVNRGVGGNAIPDLQERWEEDAIEINPDFMSILIGINDSRRPHPEGLPHDKWYDGGYRRLLDRSFAKNPNLKVMMLEPFTLKYAAYLSETDEEYAKRRETLASMCEAAKRIAKEYGCAFVELQKYFDAAVTDEIPSTYWIWDGLHPTEAGNQIIAEKWLEAAAPLLGI